MAVAEGERLWRLGYEAGYRDALQDVKDNNAETIREITELVKAAELRSLRSPARTYDGLPFPAIVPSAALRAILGKEE